ncbi:hypothetical protein JA1_003993 [Spathaspora sp. JA1]|nr:hypothetical protein JA1_003993 [Spathaspora sp. JA1]
MSNQGITYIITSKKRQTLEETLESIAENADITYINSTSPEILINPYPLVKYHLNYERFDNLRQLVEYVENIKDHVVIIEDLSVLLERSSNINETNYLLVQLVKQLYTHTSFLLDVKRIEFIALMVDKAIN